MPSTTARVSSAASASAATPLALITTSLGASAKRLGLDKVPAGVGPDHNDEIIYDLTPDKSSASGYGHALCKGSESEIAEQIHAGFVPRWAKVTR